MSLNFFTPMDVEQAVLETGGYAELNMRNVHPVVSLALQENAKFSGVLSRQYTGGGITIYIHYSVLGIATGDIKLETYIGRELDLESDGWSAAQTTGDITVPATSGLVDVVSTTHTDGTQMESVAAGAGFRFWVKRVAVAGTDAGGDVEILFIEIRNS